MIKELYHSTLLYNQFLCKLMRCFEEYVLLKQITVADFSVLSGCNFWYIILLLLSVGNLCPNLNLSPYIDSYV